MEGNREGMEWLLRFCEDHDVSVQRRAALTYAADQSEVQTVEEEHAAAESLGLDVVWRDRLDVPFPAYGATELADQAQFDPMDVLAALVASSGTWRHPPHRPAGEERVPAGTPSVTTDDGHTLRADQVVLATGTPILDRGLYFAKVEPQRSYCLAFTGAQAPEGMYLSAGSDSRSVRDAPRPEGELLVVGGSGHTVGRTRSELEHVDALRSWAAEHFPGAVETHRWSAQDYQSHDGIPYVGALPRGGGRIHLATGFEKWGMSNGVAAARAISAQILGGEQPPWSATMGHRVTRPSGAAEIVKTNLGVGMALAGGVAHAAAQRVPGRRTESERPCGVVGICTHLGGVLKWNDAEESWDCPLHGSRFDGDGAVLEGPATRPLLKRPGGGHATSHG